MFSISPARIGYNQCPAPCDEEAPTLDGFEDVAACLTCMIKHRVSAIHGSSQGMPESPMFADEANCHRAIGKQVGKVMFGQIKGAREVSAARREEGRGRVHRRDRLHGGKPCRP